MVDVAARYGGAAYTKADGYAHTRGARLADAAIREGRPSFTIPGNRT
jgi:hypothetical protein